jgi:hypothetical protein
MSLARMTFGLAASLSLSTLTASAFAQEPPPPTTPPTSTPTDPQQPVTVQPPPPAPAPEAKPYQGPTDEELAEKSRFRIAVHVLGGPWFVPDRTGGGGGLGIQLGSQLNDLIGIYYSGTAAVGVAGSSDVQGVGSSVGAWVYNSVMMDFTLFRLLQLGLGPSLDSLAFGSADVKAPSPGSPAPSAKAVGLAGTYVGIQTRVGLALDGRKAGKAARFMLGLEIHPTFADVTPVSAFLTIGGGWF